MTHSHHSSSGSVSCRLEWRSSRWVSGALSLLGIFAALSILISEMPRLAAWPLALSAVAYGLRRAWRESRSPACEFFFPGNDLPVMLDGVQIDLVEVQWRGSLAFVRWQGRDGRSRYLSWWPDTLPATRRRELRLAAGSLAASRQRHRMAP
jgi:toxin CptA